MNDIYKTFLHVNSMKLKDLFSIAKNSKNNQINFSLKKKELKKLSISEDELLNLKFDKKLRKLL